MTTAKQVRLCLSDCAMNLDHIAFDLTREDAKAFKSFLEAYNLLSNSKPGKERALIKLELNHNIGKATEVIADFPDDDSLAILLHRLRPFILTKEPGSFDKVMGILGRKITQQNVRNLLKRNRMLYDGRQAQSQLLLKSDDTVINSEPTLLDWLNSHEYHHDEGKRRKIAKLLDDPMNRLTKSLWIWLLLDKKLAIQNAAGLIELSMGLVGEFHFDHMILRNKSP
jgi:hypothetical protein